MTQPTAGGALLFGRGCAQWGPRGRPWRETSIYCRIWFGMLTDAPPRKKNRELFVQSDRLKPLALPGDGRLPRIAGTIESAMKAEAIADVRRMSTEFLTTASDFYRVRTCSVRV